MGPARGRRRQRLRALLRRAARQEGAHLQAQGAAQGRRRALPRHRRGPRGRGDRLAPARRAQAQGHPGPPDGLPRDHQAGDPRRGRQPARDQRRTSSRPRRPAASSTASTATRSARCCGRRSCPACPPAACSRVATRLVVDHERERMAFRVASYWDLEGTFDAGAEQGPADVPGQAALDRRRAGSPAAPTSATTASSRTRRATGSTSTAPAPRRWSPALQRHDVRRPLGRGQALPPLSPTRRSAPPRSSRRPAASSACRASVTMSVAQRLYENGFITYMRTDSTTLSGAAVDAARSQVRELYGAEYLPDEPRDLRQQGQERPGGARGDPPVRRDASAPRRRPA